MYACLCVCVCVVIPFAVADMPNWGTWIPVCYMNEAATVASTNCTVLTVKYQPILEGRLKCFWTSGEGRSQRNAKKGLPYLLFVDPTARYIGLVVKFM